MSAPSQRFPIVLATLIASSIAESAGAANWCVDTSLELVDALSAASSNEEPDSIRVVRGYYGEDAETDFDYFASGHPEHLWISGGWLPGCGGKFFGPQATWLSADVDTGTVLKIQLSDSSSDIRVENLTLVGGNLTFQGGGLDLSCGGAATCNLIVVDNIVRQSETFFSGGGMYIVAGGGTLRVVGNVVSENECGPGGSLEIHWSGAATAEVHHNTVAFNLCGGFELIGTGPFQASNNIGWANTGGADFDIGENVVLLNNNWLSLTGIPAAGSSGNQSVEPMFFSSHLRLAPGSPLENDGFATPAGGLPQRDADGGARVLGPAPDPGAFELGNLFRDDFESGTTLAWF